MQPLKVSVTVHTYHAVPPGVAIGFQMFALLTQMDGVHEYERFGGKPGTVAVRLAVCPWQSWLSLVATTKLSNWPTVMVTLSVRSHPSAEVTVT